MQERKRVLKVGAFRFPTRIKANGDKMSLQMDVSQVAGNVELLKQRLVEIMEEKYTIHEAKVTQENGKKYIYFGDMKEKY